jgi:hypothetical protein
MRGGAGGPHEVAVNHDVGLDDAFTGEDDVLGTEDRGAARDLVARFLGGSCQVNIVGWCGGSLRSQCIPRERRVWVAY